MADAQPTPAARIAALSEQAWGLAALGAAVESGLVERIGEPRDAAALAEATGVPEVLAARLLEVLNGLGLVDRDGAKYVAAENLTTDGPRLDVLRADLRSTLLQTEHLFASARAGSLSLDGWRHTDVEILQAQGTMSAGAVEFLERVLFPRVPGVLDRLRADTATFLDVGAGVGAVTIELCRRFPAVHAVGLEPQDAPLALARRNVAEAGLEDRVELRRQLVQDLEDEAAFDVVWLPATFLPRDVLAEALVTVLRALRPGGLLLLATLGGGGEDLASAAARLRATLWGGDAIAPEDVVGQLERAGYADIVVLDRMPSGLQPMHARRPA